MIYGGQYLYLVGAAESSCLSSISMGHVKPPDYGFDD